MSDKSYNLSDLSKQFQYGLDDIYKKSGFVTVCREIEKRVIEKRDEILLAWFAMYGFEPGKAMVVREYTEDGICVYITERMCDAVVTQSCKMHSCCNCGNAECPMFGVNCSKFIPKDANT
jgi:hypothetical protein